MGKRCFVLQHGEGSTRKWTRGGDLQSVQPKKRIRDQSGYRHEKLDSATLTQNRENRHWLTVAEEQRMVALVEARQYQEQQARLAQFADLSLWQPRPYREVTYRGQEFWVVWDGA